MHYKMCDLLMDKSGSILPIARVFISNMYFPLNLIGNPSVSLQWKFVTPNNLTGEAPNRFGCLGWWINGLSLSDMPVTFSNSDAAILSKCSPPSKFGKYFYFSLIFSLMHCHPELYSLSPEKPIMVGSLDELILPTLTSNHCFDPCFNWTGIAVGDADEFRRSASLYGQMTMLVDADLSRSFAT